MLTDALLKSIGWVDAGMTGDQTINEPWYPLIVNREAGQADRVDRLLETAAALSEETGCSIEPKEIEPAHLTSTLKALIEKRPQAVLVAGGDGTLNTAANILFGSEVPFGPLPFGTFNLYTQELGISLDPEEALTQLVKGRPRWVDVGQVNDRVFLRDASIGIYSYLISGWDRVFLIRARCFLFSSRFRLAC